MKTIIYFISTVLFLNSCSNPEKDRMINDVISLEEDIDELTKELSIANTLAETNEPFLDLQLQSIDLIEDPKKQVQELREIANEKIKTANLLDSLSQEIKKREKQIEKLELLIKQ